MSNPAIPDEVFSGKPHRLTMGLRPLDMSTWLDADADHPQMAERRRLLDAHRDEVFGEVSGHETASLVLAQAVADHVGQRLPGADHPLIEAASLVRDDLCVLTDVDGAWVLTAAVVCFPSRWRLADKLGRDVVGIHDPVPRYRHELGTPTTRVFATARPRWRVNWTLLDDPALFQPGAPSSATHSPGPRSFLRVERQCLVPLRGAVAFTIRTDVIRVSALPVDRAEAVLASARTTPPDLRAYRGWGDQ